MYQLYFLDHLLILGQNTSQTQNLKSKLISSGPLLIAFIDDWIKDDERIDTCVYGYPPDNMFTDLITHFRFIEAAGGVVRNQNNQLLFIKRWGKWDLPKGKREKGEQVEACALREVNEETGIAPLKIVKTLPDSFHFYIHKQKTVIKKTFWFLMETDFTKAPVPQQEEDITQAIWMDKGECIQALSTSYRSLRESLSSTICKLI